MCDPSLLVVVTVGTGTEKQMEKKLVSKKAFLRLYLKLENTQEY